jgi:hypothetical protein
VTASARALVGSVVCPASVCATVSWLREGEGSSCTRSHFHPMYASTSATATAAHQNQASLSATKSRTWRSSTGSSMASSSKMIP